MLPGIPQGFQSGPSFPSIISPSDSSAFRIHVRAHPKYRSQACQHNQLLGYRFRCYTNIYICIYISPSQLFQTRRSRVSYVHIVVRRNPRCRIHMLSLQQFPRDPDIAYSTYSNCMTHLLCEKLPPKGLCQATLSTKMIVPS